MLFHRDNRTVTLTQEGMRFVEYARETTTQWNLIRHELTENSGELRGEISIYCSVTASYSFLFELLNRFRQVHPGIEIKLHTGDPDKAISRVLDSSEELTIAARPQVMNKGLAFKPITKSPLVFIAPREPHSNVPTSVPSTMQEWSTIPMILSEAGVSRNSSG